MPGSLVLTLHVQRHARARGQSQNLQHFPLEMSNPLVDSVTHFAHIDAHVLLALLQHDVELRQHIAPRVHIALYVTQTKSHFGGVQTGILPRHK